MKIIFIWYTTFVLSLCFAHKSMCKNNGAILEFMLFPDKSELTKSVQEAHIRHFQWRCVREDANFIICSAGALCANFK